MKLLNTLIWVTAAGFGYHFWHQHRVAAQAAADELPGAGEFVSVEMPDGAEHNKVLILAPVNCPSAAAKRADRLADKLTQMGIPNARSNNYSAHYNSMTVEEQAKVKRTREVLGGQIPAVFVNGLAKGNPSADEVAAAFQRTQ